MTYFCIMSTFEYKHLIPADFMADSTVWIYQSNRRFLMSEALEIENMLQAFAADWKSHGAPVKGFATIFFGQFIVLMADQSATTVGGCSTDSSVRLIKAIEKAFGVQLFDRLSLAFIKKDKVELLPYAQLQYAIDNGFIHAETIYFNNLVNTRNALENNWMIPVKDSWLANKLTVKS